MDKKIYNDRISYCKDKIFKKVNNLWDLAEYHCEDNKIIMQCIYYVVWNSFKDNIYSLPELYSIDDVTDGKYGGETINTYSTYFGSDDEKLKLYEFNDNEKQIIKTFREKYLTIGNFMLLPKEKNNQSLNQIKCHYGDYADLFYYDLFETGKLNEIKQKNNFYFDKINAKEFCTKNFLEPYFYIQNNTYFINKNIFMRDSLCEKKDFLVNYAKKSCEIINYRAYKICCILNERFN